MERILVLILFVASLQAQAISIITDLDDTIKITNVENKPRALWNALFNREAFKGMPELLSNYSKEGGDIFIVSASPNLFNRAIQDFLIQNEIDVKELYLRKLSELGRKEEYKLASIREILNTYPGEYILLGDDVEIDAKIYAQIKEEYPDQVKAVYIHQVRGGRDLPGTKFFSAFDIVASEVAARRLGQAQFASSLLWFTTTVDYSKVFPNFKNCPTVLEVFNSDLPRLMQIGANGVYRRIVGHCEKRSQN